MCVCPVAIVYGNHACVFRPGRCTRVPSDKMQLLRERSHHSVLTERCFSSFKVTGTLVKKNHCKHLREKSIEKQKSGNGSHGDMAGMWAYSNQPNAGWWGRPAAHLWPRRKKKKVKSLSQGCWKETGTAEKALLDLCLEFAQRLVGDTKAAWKKVLRSDEVKLKYSFCLGSDLQPREAELYHK